MGLTIMYYRGMNGVVALARSEMVKSMGLGRCHPAGKWKCANGAGNKMSMSVESTERSESWEMRGLSQKYKGATGRCEGLKRGGLPCNDKKRISLRDRNL